MRITATAAINLSMMLLSRKSRSAKSVSSQSPVPSRLYPQAGPKPWKESATLMLVAPLPPSHKEARKYENHDSIHHRPYEKANPANKKSQLCFLLLTRSADSPFLGRSVCFPGGKVDKIDNCKEWIKLYLRGDGVHLRTLQFLHQGACQPAIYIPTPDDHYSREIIFRITAIRETFEESGILLCKPCRNSRNLLIDLTYNELEIWQKAIRDNSNEFLTFCEKYECLPDLWSLTEFSNWHAPTIFGEHRFDTMFYMTLLSKIPTTIMDSYEVSSIQWVTARDVLHEFKSEKPLWWLPVPQFYEMFRLRNVLTFDDMKKLLQLRLQFGIEKWLPVYHKTIDGTFEVLPGDDLYPKPEELNLFDNVGLIEHPFTLEELRKQVEMLHRIEFSNINYDTYVVRNISNRFGHVYDLTVKQ